MTTIELIVIWLWFWGAVDSFYGSLLCSITIGKGDPFSTSNIAASILVSLFWPVWIVFDCPWSIYILFSHRETIREGQKAKQEVWKWLEERQRVTEQ